MDRPAEIANLDQLEEMFVIAEVAALLGIKTGRVHQMIEHDELVSRFATLQEISVLLATGRIKGVPGSGIRLVPRYAAFAAQGRRRPGWQKGRPRSAFQVRTR